MRTQRSRRTSRAIVLAVLGTVAACDIPSSAPILQQTWVVPADSIQVGVSQILPAGVLLNVAGTAFVVSVPAPGAYGATLGQLCGQPACQSGAAVVAPIPAFTSAGAALSRTVAFPATVSAATVASGTLTLQVSNSLGFDPLRPNGAAAPYGSVAITITSGATSATTTIDGSAQAMPAGISFLNVAVPAGAYGASFTVAVAFNVPAGGNATLASTNAITLTPTVTGVTVSSATVVVNNEPISTSPTAFDLSDVDFADRVEAGLLQLDVTNPFTASAALNLVIQAPAQGGSPAVSIPKAVNIPPTPTAVATVTLSKAELQSLLGKTGVTISVNGTATGIGAGNTVTVTPTQVLRLRSNVQVVINVGG